MIRRLHNPILFPELAVDFTKVSNDFTKVPGLPMDDVLKGIEGLQSSLEEQMKLSGLGQHNFAPVLYIDESQTNEGFGGFYSAGYVPDFFSSSTPTKSSIHKDFEFYWPKCPHTGKYMRYLCSVNLGCWLQIFAALFETGNPNKNKDKFFQNPFYGNHYILPWGKILHIFVSDECHYNSPVPDCHIRITDTYGQDPSDLSKEEYVKFFHDWQNKTCKTTINGLPVFFSQPRIGVEYDGLEDAPDDYINNFFFNGPQRYDFKLFGAPYSQQEPRRYLAPNSFSNWRRALVPMFTYTDQDIDFSYQFYGDIPCMDQVRYKAAYCKIDGSCT